MDIIKDTFGEKRVVLPVIHVENKTQALRNAEIARKAEAGGVFLISMKLMEPESLSEIQKAVKNEFSTWWVGVNYLNVPTVKVFDKLDNGVSGVWSDNARINEWAKVQFEARAIKRAREKSGWKGLYFGGVAFKYQREVDNLALAASIATQYVDVITTSGEGTGFAPSYDKIALIKAAVGNFPVAIASGISPENASKYNNVADCYLVATSLLKPGTENFDFSRVKALVEAVRG